MDIKNHRRLPSSHVARLGFSRVLCRQQWRCGAPNRIPSPTSRRGSYPGVRGWQWAPIAPRRPQLIPEVLRDLRAEWAYEKGEEMNTHGANDPTTGQEASSKSGVRSRLIHVLWTSISIDKNLSFNFRACVSGIVSWRWWLIAYLFLSIFCVKLYPTGEAVEASIIQVVPSDWHAIALGTPVWSEYIHTPPCRHSSPFACQKLQCLAGVPRANTAFCKDSLATEAVDNLFQHAPWFRYILAVGFVLLPLLTQTHLVTKPNLLTASTAKQCFASVITPIATVEAIQIGAIVLWFCRRRCYRFCIVPSQDHRFRSVLDAVLVKYHTW